MRAGFCVMFCLLLTGCGGGGPGYSSNLIFPFQPGQSWVMASDRGELTFFETLSVQNVGCATGEEADLHITKLDAAAYWDPGVSGAEVHWVMHHDANGQWRA